MDSRDLARRQLQSYHPQVARPNNKEGYKTIIQEEESLGNNWDITMNRLLTNQEERIRKLEEGICATESTKIRIEFLENKIQNRCQQIQSISNNNEIILPELLNKAQASSVWGRTAEADVDQRLIEMGKKLHAITKIKLNKGALPREEDDLTNVMNQGTSSVLLECMSLELEELARTRHSDRMITEELTLKVLELQERINSSMSSTS